jgi:5-(carboxyamino)imidazole ribonucleotide synthase
MKIGILGAGQLARMLSLAAFPLGLETLSLVANPEHEKNGVTPVFPQSWNSPQAIENFAAQVNVVTYETENIPLEIAQSIQNYCAIFPGPTILATTQDRLLEKNFLRSLSIPTADFCAINSLEDLFSASEKIGLPAVLKTRRHGYDGKGQMIIREHSDLEAGWRALHSNALILEKFITYDAEVSIIMAKNLRGEFRFYPISHNTHREGILFLSQAPYEKTSLQTKAEKIAEKIALETNYVGVLAIEFFQVGENLLVNELAPRVHNSGHWTIEGAATNQFENHLRAILDLPLGATTAKGFGAMINLIGHMPQREDILSVEYAHFHTYDKKPRPKRKLGHVTLHCPDKLIFDRQLKKLLHLIEASPTKHG